MKNTDKVTLTVGQLKKLVKEAQELNTYLIVYIDKNNENRHKEITIDALNIQHALNIFAFDVTNKIGSIKILKIEKMY